MRRIGGWSFRQTYQLESTDPSVRADSAERNKGKLAEPYNLDWRGMTTTFFDGGDAHVGLYREFFLVLFHWHERVGLK
jgi:hypothetical protein